MSVDSAMVRTSSRGRSATAPISVGQWSVPISSVLREVVARLITAGLQPSDLHQDIVEQGRAPNRNQSGVIQAEPRVSLRTTR